MVVGWRTVPPAAWLRVNPSVEVFELEWMAQADFAGGRGQGGAAGLASGRTKSHTGRTSYLGASRAAASWSGFRYVRCHRQHVLQTVWATTIIVGTVIFTGHQTQ